MDGFKHRVDELASLMEEFQLREAKLEGEGWKVAFRSRRMASNSTPHSEGAHAHAEANSPATEHSNLQSTMEEPLGEPLTSPMNGIYYSQPSANAQPFVREGEEVEEGQVVSLIEAMKVFNEIVAPTKGKVTKIVAMNNELVQNGDVLMYIVASE